MTLASHNYVYCVIDIREAAAGRGGKDREKTACAEMYCTARMEGRGGVDDANMHFPEIMV